MRFTEIISNIVVTFWRRLYKSNNIEISVNAFIKGYIGAVFLWNDIAWIHVEMHHKILLVIFGLFINLLFIFCCRFSPFLYALKIFVFAFSSSPFLSNLLYCYNEYIYRYKNTDCHKRWAASDYFRKHQNKHSDRSLWVGRNIVL